MNAPGFAFSPSVVPENIIPPPGGSTTLSFVVVPQTLGTYQISFESGDNYAEAGIRVIPALGWSAAQAEFAAYFGTGLGLAIALLAIFSPSRRRESK